MSNPNHPERPQGQRPPAPAPELPHPPDSAEHDREAHAEKSRKNMTPAERAEQARKDAVPSPPGKKTTIGAPHDPATDFRGEKPAERADSRKQRKV